jgi:hypothetical protein
MASMVLRDILHTGDYIGRETVAIAVHDFDGVKDMGAVSAAIMIGAFACTYYSLMKSLCYRIVYERPSNSG